MLQHHTRCRGAQNSDFVTQFFERPERYATRPNRATSWDCGGGGDTPGGRALKMTRVAWQAAEAWLHGPLRSCRRLAARWLRRAARLSRGTRGRLLDRLSDVPEDHGPTHIVPLPVTAGAPALPHGYLRPQRPEFYARHGSAPTPATSTPTTNGPAAIRGETTPSTRTGTPFAEQATARQLQLFGFPPPGHPYWTPQTLRDLAVRYPGLDTSPWQPGEARGTEL
jgi:hypothetical protein